MKKIQGQRRQGDVLTMKTKVAKTGLKPIDREAGRVILAHGEVTGHAHAISEQAVKFLTNESTLQRILEIKEPATLRHEEHRAFELPVGDYEVVIQREWRRKSIVSVLD